MTGLIKPALLAALLIPGAAIAAINVGDTAGTSPEAIRAALTAQGYEVLRIETDDGDFEVDARMGGTLFEIEVARSSGMVTGIEMDDDREDDDHDESDDDDDDGKDDDADGKDRDDG